MISIGFPLMLGGKLALTPITTTAVVSSSIFVLGSVVFLIVGLICGHCWRLCKQSTKETVNQPALCKQHTPLYEAVLPKVMKHQESHDLELKENEAYGSVR